jgi:Ca2+-binding RTX toxin-like protein
LLLDNAASATATVRVSNANVEFDTTDTLSSLLITTGSSTAGGAIDVRGVQFDPAVTIQVDADFGMLDVFTSTDADASLSAAPVNLFGSGSTGLNLTGSSRAGEFLSGGSGADRLDGGGGYVDRYIGNEGADTFVFRFAPNNAGAANGALLQDFEHGVDKLELNQTNGAFANVVDDGSGGLDDADFLAIQAIDLANPGGQHVIFELSTGALYYDADGADGNDPEIFAQAGLDVPQPTIDADDFAIV